MTYQGSLQNTELEDAASQVLPGGLKVVDVSQGDGPEPQIGEKIKVENLSLCPSETVLNNFPGNPCRYITQAS